MVEVICPCLPSDVKRYIKKNPAAGPESAAAGIHGVQFSAVTR
jgi:hypothetical protein